MFISGNTSYRPANTLIGNLSSTKSTGSSLVYIYPLMFDNSLMKKWEGLIRDFQTAQFVNQIKTTNVLNITQVIVNQADSQDSQNDIFNALNAPSGASTTDAYHQMMMQQMLLQQRQQNAANATNEYTRRSYEIQQYIKGQITNDPRYDNLRPAFSLISLERNLVDIPLILGTKSYKINSSGLYWILFVALSTNQNSIRDNLNNIINTVLTIPRDQYLNILRNSYLPTPLANQIDPSVGEQGRVRAYNQLRTEMDQGLKKATQTFNTVANSLSDFESDIGFSTNISADSAVYTSVVQDTLPEQDEHRSNSNANINNSVVNLVFPLLQNINNILANPAVSIDFNDRYRKLLKEIIDIADAEFLELIGIVSNMMSTNNKPQDQLNVLERNCKALNQSDANEVLKNINAMRLFYRDLLQTGATENVINQLEILQRTSQAVHGSTSELLRRISDITRDPSFTTRNQADLATRIAHIRNNTTSTVGKLRKLILDFFYDSTEPNNLYVPANPIIPGPIASLFNGFGLTSAHVDDLMVNSINALANIVNYIIISSLVQSTCNYLKIVNTRINIKSRNITEFPNYTLVIPIEYVTTLYYALAARNLHQAVNDINDSNLNKFKLSEQNINVIINAVVDRLNVPNIIIVDDSKNEIHYRWCFLNRTFKMNASTLQNYIKSQQSIIRAF